MFCAFLKQQADTHIHTDHFKYVGSVVACCNNIWDETQVVASVYGVSVHTGVLSAQNKFFVAKL